MTTKTYDPLRNVLTIGDIQAQGFADGTSITINTPPGFSKKVGIDGEVTRTRLHDRSGTLTLVLMQTSATNQELSALYDQDRRRVNGGGVVPLQFTDLDGATLFESAKSWIADDPDFGVDLEAQTRTWVIEFGDHNATHACSPSE
jgi:hypothetical protein